MKSRSVNRYDTQIPVSRGVQAAARMPARRKVQRLPMQATSVGHLPTPDLRSSRRPPWNLHPTKLHGKHGRHSPSHERFHKAYLAGEASLQEVALLGNVAARKGVRATGSQSSLEKTGCNPAIETCCNPADPPQVYEDCKLKNEQLAHDEAAYIPICTVLCERNCCCFFATSFRASLMILLALKQWLLGQTVMVMVQLTGFSNVMANENSTKAYENEDVPSDVRDPDESIIFARGLVQDILKCWIGICVGGYLIVRIHEGITTLHHYITAMQTIKGAEIQNKELDITATVEALKWIDPIEKERLGDIMQSITVEVKSVSRNLWHFINIVSFGLFYWIWGTKNKARTVMVLGSSGRFMIIKNTPITSMKTAFLLFTATGLSMMGTMASLMSWLRTSEQMMINARKSPNPEVRHAAKQQKDFFSQNVVGNVHVFVLLGFLSMWLFQLIVLKLTLRPWAKGDWRGFFDACDANCVQYFRGGVRSMIPCICGRRRTGSLQMFFGPYPEKELFNESGGGYEGMFLHSIEPHIAMCNVNDHADEGSPPCGNHGQAQSAEGQSNKMAAGLGFLNWLLGAIGLFCFFIHIFNLTQNLELCPNTAFVNKCVRQGDCTRYVQSGWFQMYAERSGMMSPQEAAERALRGNVKLAHLAMWMNLTTMEDATYAAVMIAKKTCLDRRQELIDVPVTNRKPKGADTLGAFNAQNYNMARTYLELDVSWDGDKLECKRCRDATALHYFSSFENGIEVIEVMILLITCYVSAQLMRVVYSKKTNSTSGVMDFESDPMSGVDMPVKKIEKAALGMMNAVLFCRYQGKKGIPPQVKDLETKMRWAQSQGFDPTKLADPWMFTDSNIDSWDDYDLISSTNNRMIQVSREVLGILDGEEVLSAWSESPRLTFFQKIWLVLGFFCFMIAPCVFGAIIGQTKCFVEGIVGGLMHLAMFHYMVLRRRPQCGFVLTTRRVFQISRTPAFYDLCGKNEPILKIDVLVHNAGLTYVSGVFEGMITAMKRILKQCCGWPIYRSGSLTLSGDTGIFTLWRDMGDTREILLAFSRCAYAEKARGVTEKWGYSMMNTEKALGITRTRDPGFPCILCCCPFTPDAVGEDSGLLKRYCLKFDKEEEVYERMFTIRPGDCCDLCCGKITSCKAFLEFLTGVGWWFSYPIPTALYFLHGAQNQVWDNVAQMLAQMAACGIFGACCCIPGDTDVCCPSCLFNETITDFAVTSHRVLVEQKVNQRYCRYYMCYRPVPNIRITFICNQTLSGYVVDKPGFAYGMNKMRQDLVVKLLPEGNREFPPGLVMKQKPYAYFTPLSHDQAVDHVWVTHIMQLFDRISEKADMKEIAASSSEDEDDPKGKGSLDKDPFSKEGPVSY